VGMKNPPSNKVPLTIRTHPASLERLKNLAQAQKKTVSSLVDEAIETLIAGQSGVSDNDFLITKEDIEQFLRVLDAIGKPVSLSLFLKIMSIQKGA
jgi:predicted DNA-binding protein